MVPGGVPNTKAVQIAERQLRDAEANAEAAATHLRAAKRRLGWARYGHMRITESAGGFEPLSPSTCQLLDGLGVVTYSQLIAYGVDELKDLLRADIRAVHEVIAHLELLGIPPERNSPPPYNGDLDQHELQPSAIRFDPAQNHLLAAGMDMQLAHFQVTVPPSLRNQFLAWVRALRLSLEPEASEDLPRRSRNFSLTKP